MEIVLLCEDGTGKIPPELQYLVLNDKRIKLLSGQSLCDEQALLLALAFQEAKGDYILIVRAEDRLGSNYIEELYRCVADNHPDIVTAAGHLIEDELGRSGLIKHDCEMMDLDGDHANWPLPSANLWDKLLRREFLVMMADNGILLKPSSRQEFWFKAFGLAQGIKASTTVDYHYNDCRDADAKANLIGGNPDQIHNIFLGLLDWADEQRLPAEYRAYLMTCELKICVNILDSCEPSSYGLYFTKISKLVNQIAKGSDRKLLESFEGRHAQVISHLISADIHAHTALRSDNLRSLLIYTQNGHYKYPQTVSAPPWSMLSNVNRNILYWPDFSDANEYQKLTYEYITWAAGSSCIGLNVATLSLEAVASMSLYCSIFHFHWIHPILGKYADCPHHFAEVLQCMKRQYGYRILWTVHNLYSHKRFCSRSKELELRRLLAMHSDRLVVHSDLARETICNEYLVESAKVSVFPHPLYKIPIAQEVRLQEIDQALPSLAPIRLLFFGDLRPYKRLRFAIRMVQMHNSRNPESRVSLIVAGKPISEHQSRLLTSLVEGDAAFVMILRRISDSEIKAIFDDVTAVLLAHPRSLCSGILHLAFSSHVPFIAYPCVATKELSSRGLGLLYENQFEFSEAISALRTSLNALKREIKRYNCEAEYPSSKVLDSGLSAFLFDQKTS
ncbi:glycosyltransferase family 4 protein [Synechococcus sp. BSF8S]|uniref:hypothetical protein n=1 Tax=Synechococcales TaxID=1890424 RepID=UPI0016251260|nr:MULTISPECIES: hypothetical protein [unclassified Synechococcus]MBC1262550.1 glycosyltransferase family 4 protein [Synechococcus sp. BSF8S]MBC1265441.1 glycosyltransferase family 4 protein [Synechococcus sp. BSA11S]